MAAENNLNMADASTEFNNRDLVITTNDNRNFTVKVLVARMIKIIGNNIKYLNDDLDLSDNFSLPNVDGPMFEKVLEWCEEHKSKTYLVLFKSVQNINLWLILAKILKLKKINL